MDKGFMLPQKVLETHKNASAIALLELGLIPRKTFDIDHQFFETFQT